MASSSKMKLDDLDQEEEDQDWEVRSLKSFIGILEDIYSYVRRDAWAEFERFDDFTLASSWERFISEIEAICRQWLADGPKNLMKKGAVCVDKSKSLCTVRIELKYAAKSYCMEYYFENNHDGNVGDWCSTLHDLQLSFGVKDFLVIAPQSASGVVLDAPEASKLLSAVAIALSNCASFWPAFVPVHDPSRKAFIGIQNMGTNFTRRFEGDRIGSQVPVKLMHLEGLYELFVSKFAFSTLDLSTHHFRVHFTMKLTYRSFTYDGIDSDEEVQGEDTAASESGEIPGSDNHYKTQWDDDCPWSEWYSAEDPVKGIDLLAIWREKTVESSLDMAELENTSPHEAEKWFICPNISSNFVEPIINRIGFASQLQLLVNALNVSFETQFMEDFVSVENSGSDSLKSSAIIPPPTVLDHVLKDLFHEAGSLFCHTQSQQVGTLKSSPLTNITRKINQNLIPTSFINPQSSGLQLFDSTEFELKSSRAIKGASLQSLFAQFCLHSLWFGNCNIRAIAVLWIEFVREVRWCWEESQPLPRMSTNGGINLSTCLVNQKLHMLAICIEKKRQSQNRDSENSNRTLDQVEAGRNRKTRVEERDSPIPDADTFVGLKPLDNRKGSAGFTGMMLLKTCQKMHVPLTQESPLMTEDMHEERLSAIEALGDSFNISAQLEKDILASDMSAFKAANPDAVFEDFIRWHSPRDWENDGSEEDSYSSINNWPPRGRLSDRMAERGNLWRKIWNDAPALPASEQKPILDPNREGEKVLHYLETLRPHLLLEQMVCTAFRAAAGILNQTSFGGLKRMTTNIDQLYLTMASTLKSLQANRVTANCEIIDDMRRLSVVFEHVEELLTVAASLHRKFFQAPRLSEEIFNDYCNYYQPTRGINSVKGKVNLSFDKKQLVGVHEREVVANMFTPPTANQSWRKVLSLGNLLSGHEPVLREIIFSMRDRVRGSYYAATNAGGYDKEIETYRMYTCGTSNDLSVALSVSSFD